MRWKRGIAAAFAALLIAAPMAWAAGMWPNLPVAGGPSYCSSTVTGTGSLGGITGQGQGTTGSICATTVPAGPSPAFTGAETFPMDTNATGGTSPQTVLARICQVGGGAYAFVSPTALTATVADNICYWVMSGAALASFTLTMPPNPIDGQLLTITTKSTITALTLSANTTVVTTQAISNAPSALTVSATGAYGYKFIYHASDTTWYRVQ